MGGQNMNTLENRFSLWVIQQRWWLLLLVPVLVLIAAMGAKNLHFTNNYRVFFSADNPQLNAFVALENTYTKTDNVLFLLTPKQGDVFTPASLEAVEWLTEQAWQLPYSIRVDSISNFQHTIATDDDLIVQNLYEDAAALDPNQLAEIRRVALSEPQLRGQLITPDGKVTGVNVTIQLPGVDETAEVPETVAKARAIAQEFKQRYPDIELRLNGMVLMNNAFSSASQGDMKALVPLSIAAMLVLLGLLLWAFAGTLVTLVVIFLSIAFGLGVGGWIGFPITPPAASAPIIILTIAIASSVHVLVSFYEELGRRVSSGEALNSARASAMAESLRINVQPVLLTSVTTAIGFLSMNFSDAPPFRHLGNFVAAGVVGSMLLTLTVLPALMVLLPTRPRHRTLINAALMGRLANWVIGHQKPVLWGMLSIVVVLTGFISRNELNDVFVHYFDESMEFRRDADYLDKTLGGLYRVELSLPSAEQGGISEPDYLAKLDALTRWLRTQPEVVFVNSLSDTMKRLNKNMHGDDPNYYKTPDRRDLAAQYLLLYEMSLPLGLDLNNQISVDKSTTRVSIGMHSMSTKQVLAFEQRIQDWLAANAPAMQSPGSGPTVMFAHIGERNIRSMLTGTTLALVLISAILILALRNLKLGLVSLVPNLVPAAMGFGIWGLLVGEVGLALSVVTGMTLGIVVDDTVHFLSKYRRARREHQLGAEDAVRYAFDHVGMAMLITSIVLAVGFAILAMSHFTLNADMGLLTAIVIVLALLADFLLLPTLLLKLEGKNA